MAWTNDMPVLSLLLSFPRKDGSPMELDPAQLADDGYNKQFTGRFLYHNRDDRFYASIFLWGDSLSGENIPCPRSPFLVYLEENKRYIQKYGL
ncbi:MAG: hypothetical protein AB2L24_03250 [Mangrovibacterium sp.]